ncbi:Uncharacterized protein APZ42_015839 [Daphnia magna]|uniref:Uncharacterized protein n=1 Tax=Daphnia magna TaxID=35525 RepID=A0A162NCR5_9CRUS|nr:Uncharacterized protein APZ42_015839 [Daphnia magna]
MTTFATTATKTNQPLQLFTMFPPGGASTLKGFTAPAFGAAATTGASSADRHQFRAGQSQHGEEDAGSGANPMLPVFMVDGPTPPVRPVRHVQHASQWAESKTTVAPGLIVRSTTATVSTSQWSEYSTTLTEGLFQGQSSSTQFQTVRNSTTQSTTGAASNPTLMSSAQYLDDLQLPTQQLDLAAQLGKGSIARKGSLGGRRPPTVRYRRVNSQGSLPYEQQHQLLQQQEVVAAAPSTALSVPTTNGTDPIRSGKNRTPPPRPPPPKFQQKPLEQQSAMLPAPVIPTLAPPATDWNSSRSGTPPSLPANSPPPLPDREDLDFVMDEGSSSASESSSTPHPGMTDVVEINDKESVGEDGEVVRRRTIITLGPRTVGGSPSAAGGSSGSINITLLNGGPVTSSPSSDLLATKAKPVTEQAVSSTTLDETHRSNARASAFNARRTIEQRRQQQQQEEEQEMQEPATNVKTLPASTYLYGERGSPASSFGGSSLRTMSISMSFDDLDESNSNASITEQQRRSGGRNRSEAWYERRQSYGFEAADKLQSLLNTSGSSDVPSITGTAVSRSCDSLCSTVRSTSSAIEKMIPPWIKNPSPKQAEEETGKSPSGSSRLSYFEQSMDDADHKPAGQPRRTPTPTSIQRSESSRSATNVLEEAEPIWLRDLRMRRSLRDGRRKPPVIKSPPPMETPIWLGVKLRPTGLSLVDPDPSVGPASSTCNLPSPTKPHHYTPIFTCSSSAERTPESNRRKSEERQTAVTSIASSSESKEETAQTSSQKAASSSIVIVNSSRESLHSVGTVDSSIELMRMLEETPLVSTNGVPLRHDRTDSASAVNTETGSVYSMGDWTESSSAVASVKNSNEDLTQMNQSEGQRKAKKVAFGADERLEEVKSTVIHQAGAVHQPTEFGTGMNPTASGSDEQRDRNVFHDERHVPLFTAAEETLRHCPSDWQSSCSSEGIEIPVSRPAPVVIRNGIVNFDSSVERKIVILEEKETIPAPKSILKKRSVENLLDIERTNEPVVKPAVIAVTQRAKKEPPPEHQEILPWRIHLKHVEQPPTIHSIPVQQQPEPEATAPPWRMDINRKKTPPFVARAPTPDNFFSRGRSPCSTTSESSTATIPGMSAAELIRNLRPNPVMMVARCQVKESVFRPTVSTDLQPETIILPLESDPSSVRADHGYHSLEPEAESSAIKRQQSSCLNETIEEIRSLDVAPVCAAKMEIGNPSASSSPYPIKIDKPSAFYPALPHSKSGSKIPENRFIVREIRPSGSVQEARTFFQSTASGETTHHRSTVASNRRDSSEADGGRLAEAPEIKATNHQLQRLRETTKLLAEGHPQLRAELAVNARLSQPNETNPNVGRHINQNGDATTSEIPTSKTSPGQKRRQSFVMTSGVEHHDVEPTIPVVHHKPSESTELRDTSVEEVMSTFDSTIEEALSDNDELRDSIIRSSVMTSTTFSSRSSTAAARLRTSSPNKTTQFTREENTSSFTCSSTPLSSGRSKPQPAKRSNSIELTSGMPEEKAALLVRKFFGNSVIETKMSRIAKTETIMEESSEFGCSSSSFSEEKTLLEAAVEAFSSPSPQPPEAYECDDFFHRPSSEAEGMSTSSFGSVLDVMDTTTDDERSIRTTSSTTMTNTTRYSSCSERSVKLSDIINRPDRPSLLDSAVSSSCATPVTDEFSYATSESASIAISVSQTTTDSSSVGSDFSRKDKNSLPAVSVKSSTRTPPSRSRCGASSSQSRGANHRSSAGSSKSAGDPAKASTSANRSGGSKSVHCAPVAAPVRPPRTLQQVNQSTEVKKRSVRTSSSGSSQADRKTSVSASAGGTPLANRTNRLVTITSYKGRNSASVKPDDASAVSGIKVTPVAVGSGHYKIRMDQRIAAAAAEKASKTTTKKTTTSQRSNGIKTTTTTLEKRSNTTSSSRNTTVKPDK